MTPPEHVTATIERLRELHPGARTETEVRWFIRAYQRTNTGLDLCVDARNIAHGDDE